VDATWPEGTSRLDRLEALRTSLEAVLAGYVPMRDFAALSREYRAVLAEIDELTPSEREGDVVDEIAQRRNARRQAAQGKARAKRPG